MVLFLPLIFCTFLKWYHILVFKFVSLYSDGTIFVAEFSLIPQFVTKFTHFALICSTVYKATFCIKKSKGGLIYWRFNPLGGYKKSAIGGLILNN